MSIEKITALLPQRVAEAINEYSEDIICEIRLRVGRMLTITTPSSNVLTSVRCTKEEIFETVEKLCGGSLHSYSDTIKNGYIPLPDGYRAGVCGRYSGGSVRDISSICIRIPRNVKGVGLSLCRRLISSGGGMLIYSPPGEGKTTLLRDISATLSSPPYLRRVAVIDTRGEIYREDFFSSSIAEIYQGYPKAYGIELATRTMSPQFIVCDELGGDEAQSIKEAQNCGVPLIATAHASSLQGLMCRPAFKEIAALGFFSLYVGIRRMGTGYSFEINEGNTLND